MVWVICVTQIRDVEDAAYPRARRRVLESQTLWRGVAIREIKILKSGVINQLAPLF
jgi:hypothetical protein